MKITEEMIAFAEGQKWSDDIRQDVYVALLEKDEGYMGEVPVEQLVTAIYNFRTIDTLRKDARRRELLLKNLSTIEGLHGSDDCHDPLEYLAAEEVFDKIDALSPLLRSTLTRYVEGADVSDIAASDGVDVNTVYQRVWKAKQEITDGR